MKQEKFDTAALHSAVQAGLRFGTTQLFASTNGFMNFRALSLRSDLLVI